ncbi:MAG: energy transducer TonB [Adhaeribacter sp.]
MVLSKLLRPFGRKYAFTYPITALFLYQVALPNPVQAGAGAPERDAPSGQPMLQAPVNPVLAAPADTLYPRTNQILVKVDQPASFPGGEGELRKFIRANLKYPPNALRNGLDGTVLVQFVVDRNGKIWDPKVANPLGLGTDEEALRVVKLLPDFKPALKDGQPVEYRYTLPFRFGIAGRRPDQAGTTPRRNN